MSDKKNVTRKPSEKVLVEIGRMPIPALTIKLMTPAQFQFSILWV